MVAPKEENFDVIGIVEDELEASIQLFFVRKGRVVGRRGLVVDKVEDLDTPALVERTLEQLYAGAAPEDVPREVLVPVEPADPKLAEAFLAEVRGARVGVRVPQRGEKRELLATVTRNAGEAFAQHKLKRASDHNARARALTALQDALGLPDAPLRIECFDISNLQGTEIVGSMVVMEDGLAKRSDYRRFKVRHQDGQDDFASMEEVLDAPVQALPRGARRGRPGRQAVRVPAQPARGGRRARAAQRRGARARGSRARGHPGRVAREASGRGVPARSRRAGAHRPRLRGALPAAAGA